MEIDDYKAFLDSSVSLQSLEPEIAGSLPAIPAGTAIRAALKTLVKSTAAGVDVNTALAEAVQYVADNK